MPKNDNWKRRARKSPRLQGYDYSQEGAYFVTSNIQGRVHLFGEIVDGEMQLSPAGNMIEAYWSEVPKAFPDMDIDLYVIMPNHFHGIVIINRHAVGADLGVSPNYQKGNHTGLPLQRTGLPEVMRWFKTMTTNAYIRGVKEKDWQPFQGKLWQRSYHDHIIRHEAALNKIREYVLYNPARWQEDRYYDG